MTQHKPETRRSGSLHRSKCCCVCGQRLTVHEAARNSHCNERKCINHVSSAARQKKIRAKAEVRNRNIATYLKANHISIKRVATVPSMNSELDLPEQHRLDQFRQNLRTALSTVAAKYDNNALDEQAAEDALLNTTANHLPSPVQVESKPGNNDSLSCQLCRGYCCGQGGDHAFLNENQLPGILRANPGMSFSQLYRHFLKQLPAQSIRHSCVYHIDTGCALSRQFRSSICNNFECDQRRDFSRMMDDSTETAVQSASSPATSEPVVLLAIDDTEVTRSHVIEPDPQSL